MWSYKSNVATSLEGHDSGIEIMTSDRWKPVAIVKIRWTKFNYSKKKKEKNEKEKKNGGNEQT